MQVDKAISTPPTTTTSRPTLPLPLTLSLSWSAGYAFLLFRDELAVHRLIKSCLTEEGKLFMFVSSVTQSHKKVVICMHRIVVM